MSERGYKILDQSSIYFISFAVVEWVDVFTRKEYAEIVIESLKYCPKEKGLVIYGWCIMSNHVYLICSSKTNDLSGTTRDFKRHTSINIIKSIEQNERESRKNWMLWIFKKAGEKNKRNNNYQFWRQDNQPKELLRHQESFAEQKLNYIHNNPVEAGIVENAEDYLYSSARDYAGKKGLIKIDFLE